VAFGGGKIYKSALTQKINYFCIRTLANKIFLHKRPNGFFRRRNFIQPIHINLNIEVPAIAQNCP
jgi:hypothetical protein